MGMDRKGFFTTANAQLQAQTEHDSMVKVLFLRGKLNHLWKTFNDKVRFHLPIRILIDYLGYISNVELQEREHFKDGAGVVACSDYHTVNIMFLCITPKFCPQHFGISLHWRHSTK
jgi:hypothetical protein